MTDHGGSLRGPSGKGRSEEFTPGFAVADEIETGRGDAVPVQGITEPAESRA
jgi:hypothetical protein